MAGNWFLECFPSVSRAAGVAVLMGAQELTSAGTMQWKAGRESGEAAVGRASQPGKRSLDGDTKRCGPGMVRIRPDPPRPPGQAGSLAYFELHGSGLEHFLFKLSQ